MLGNLPTSFTVATLIAYLMSLTDIAFNSKLRSGCSSFQHYNVFACRVYQVYTFKVHTQRVDQTSRKLL